MTQFLFFILVVRLVDFVVRLDERLRTAYLGGTTPITRKSKRKRKRHDPKAKRK